MFEECELKPISNIYKNNKCPYSGTDNIGEKRCGLINGENKIKLMTKCPLIGFKKRKGRRV